MLKQDYRFHGHNSLSFVYRNGNIVRGKTMSIKYIQNPRRKDSRVAVVISRKVLKSAPKRNRVRRRIYEFIRKNWSHIAHPKDIVALVYDPRFFDMPSQELESTLQELLEKSGIWLA